MDTTSFGKTSFGTVEMKPRIGAEIMADREVLLTGKFSKEIRTLLELRGVLVFRNVHFDDAEQKAFTGTLGEVIEQRGADVLAISWKKENARREYLRGTIFWHIDMTNMPLRNVANLLTPRVLSDVGGETEFANTYAVWENLSEEDKRDYADLRVVHATEGSQMMAHPEPSLAKLQEWRTQGQCEHPLIRTHHSGRRSLVIGATALYVVGKSHEESGLILTKLRDLATQPDFVYRHKWQIGDLVVWENTGTMHRVLPFPEDSGRMLRRTAVVLDESIY